MPVYVSASSRLHELLTALANRPGGQSLRSGWSQVLGVHEDEVQFGEFGLPVVARLVSNAGDEARRAQMQVGLPLRENLVQEWSRPLYTPGQHLDAPIANHPVSAEGLAYLHSLASVLHRTEAHDALPDGEELGALLRQLDELADSIEASELPDEVTQALLRRITQLRFAIDSARIGGPEGVEQAVELLLGAVVLRSGSVPRATAEKVFGVVEVVFRVFTAAPAVQASLGAWSTLVEGLLPSPGEGE